MDRERRLTPGREISFSYINWRGEEHIYGAIVETVAYGPFYGASDRMHLEPSSLTDEWILHAYVTRRDGMDRPGRRTFKLLDIKFITT